MSVGWCLTGNMIGNYMNTPIQGDMFRKSRDKIMGAIPAEDPGPEKVKVDQLRNA